MSNRFPADWRRDLAAVRARFALVTVGIDGRNWHVRDTAGPEVRSRPSLILLPGSLGSADIFFRQILALEKDARCVAIDYPHGSGIELADGLAALMDHLQIERAAVLGSSLAGYWLQWFGARHPERTTSVILSSAFCDGSRLRESPLFDPASLAAQTSDAVKREWLARLAAREQDEVRDIQIDLLAHAQSGDALRERLLHAATAQPAPLIKESVPVALIDCSDDPLVDGTTRRMLAERYPRAFRLALTKGGHYPHIAQPAVYTEFIRSILDAVNVST